MLRLFPALFNQQQVLEEDPPAIDLSGFAALPSEEEAAVIAAAEATASDRGVTAQEVIDACTAGHLWMSSRYSLYSNTGGTTLIAGTTGNVINAWRDWSKNALFVVNGSAPTFHAANGVDFTQDEMGVTGLSGFGAQNTWTIITARNQYSSGADHLISNAVTNDNDTWDLTSGSIVGGAEIEIYGRGVSANAASSGGASTVGAFSITRWRMAATGATRQIWRNGVQYVNSTGLTPASANPSSTSIYLHGQGDALASRNSYYKAIYAHAGDQPAATSGLVEEFINQYFGLALL